MSRLVRRFQVHTGAVLAALSCGLVACAEDAQRVTAQDQALRVPSAALGKQLFEEPLPHTNGRACATCHVLEEATTLHPESVTRRLKEDPGDPLFHPLDADDPQASELTFEHLAKGLVRVSLMLPDNMDVIDLEGQVITAPDRKIFVWRGVPSVADTAFTGPYQLDGREPTLESQAQAAITNHSEGRSVSRFELESIAHFERSVFSCARAQLVALLQGYGIPDEKIPVPESFFHLSEAQARGREVYAAACESCHGGATTERITRRDVVDFMFPSLNEAGNVRFEGQPPTHVRNSRPGERFMSIGFNALTYVGQIGLGTPFNASVALPRYRFRFYRDAARSEKWLDLPPVPQTASGDPYDLRPALDERGAPIVGPNLIPQQFTTDPGRAAITGNPADFEAFDTPPLRGIARTAPYYHDNSRETLRDVIDEYSRFLLPFNKPMALPTFPPEQAGGRKEALSPEQKNDLLEYLQLL